MSISLKLYGDLKEKIPHKRYSIGIPHTLEIETDELKTVLDILKDLDINSDEISHILLMGYIVVQENSLKKEIV